MLKQLWSLIALPSAAVLSFTAAGGADVRDVQFTEINTSTGVLTLTNLGPTDQPLDGWMLCTADNDETFKYTDFVGLNGFAIEAGTTFAIHTLNDAPLGSPDAVDVSSMGGNFAGPITNGPYGLAIYWNGPFFQPENMADYLQWTDDLANPANASADARATTAVDAGLWTSAADWVVTNDETTRIMLTDLTGAELQDSSAYEVDGGSSSCPADIDMNGEVGFGDLLGVLSNWGPCVGCPFDIDMNDEVGFGDLLAVLSLWGPCL